MGFLQAQSFDNEYKPCPRLISIPVACALSVAYGIRFEPTSNPSYRTLASVLKEAVETIDAGIDKIIFPDYILSESERILSLRINTLAYCPFNDDYNIYVGSTETLYNPDLVSDFIENLCHCFGLTAHAIGSEIVFAKYDYDGNYRDSYKLGKMITLGKEIDISNRPVDRSKCRVTYCFTDIYQQRYWTPVAP